MHDTCSTSSPANMQLPWGLLVLACAIVIFAPVAARAATPASTLVPLVSATAAAATADARVENAPLSPARTLVPLATVAALPSDSAAFATNTPRPRPPTSTPALVRAATAAAVTFPPAVTRPAPTPTISAPAAPAATGATRAMGAATAQAQIAPTPLFLPTPRSTVAPTRPVSRRLEPPPPIPPTPPMPPIPPIPAIPPLPRITPEAVAAAPRPAATATPTGSVGTAPVIAAPVIAAPVATATYANWPAVGANEAGITTPGAFAPAPMSAPVGVVTLAPPTPTVLFPSAATPARSGGRQGATPVAAASPLATDGPVRGAVLLALAAFALGGGVLVWAVRLLRESRHPHPRTRMYTRPLSVPHDTETG